MSRRDRILTILTSNGFAVEDLNLLAFNWIADTDTWSTEDSMELWVERHCLVDFLIDTNGGSWSNSLNPWMGTGVTACSWFGVTCDGNERVTEINLENNNLSGTISLHFPSLQNLKKFEIWNDDLTDGGDFPGPLLALTSLTHLSLRTIGLTGSINAGAAGLRNLEFLNMGGNSYAGTIPTQLFTLTKLEYLNIAQSVNLSGAIPSEIGQLTKLTDLYLFYNKLSGQIPSEVQDMTVLRIMHIGRNEFQITIPTEIGALNELTRLHIYPKTDDCNLTGTIPSEFVLVNIKQLHLERNNLTGSIPPLSDTIESCHLSSNSFTDTTNKGICNV